MSLVVWFIPDIHSHKGAFNNYLVRILPLFDPLPFCVDSFYTQSVDKNRQCLTPSPLHLVHIVIECLQGVYLQLSHSDAFCPFFCLVQISVQKACVLRSWPISNISVSWLFLWVEFCCRLHYWQNFDQNVEK